MSSKRHFRDGKELLVASLQTNSSSDIASVIPKLYVSLTLISEL